MILFFWLFVYFKIEYLGVLSILEIMGKVEVYVSFDFKFFLVVNIGVKGCKVFYIRIYVFIFYSSKNYEKK